MPDDAFGELLDATVRHLEDLREHGVKYVNVTPELLAAIAQPRPVANRKPNPKPDPNPNPKPSPISIASAVRPNATLEASPPIQPPRAPAPQRSAPSAATSPAPKPETAPAPAPPAPAPQKTPQALASTNPGTQPSFSLATPTRALSSAEKEAAMAALRQRALACRKCEHLAVARQNVVFGVGDIHSPLMFVGEAPGADEDLRGEPFVGKAGQLLTRIIQTMGLSRERVYIGNILKCRPDTPGQSSGNRKPTPSEMATCLPYLLDQIGIIQPKVIVALGATAVEGLFGKIEGITRTRGKWLTFRDTPVMPTYHPAYLLRNQALTEKRKVWEDMLAVMEKLGLPISEKQRGYFLKP